MVLTLLLQPPPKPNKPPVERAEEQIIGVEEEQETEQEQEQEQELEKEKETEGPTMLERIFHEGRCKFRQ